VENENNPNRLAAADAASPTSPARLLVCERTGRWAVALRRELADAGTRVWETRSLDDCWQELVQSPASFVVLELHGKVPTLLQRIARLSYQFPQARLAVAADRSMSEYQWIVREAGAVYFLCSPRRTATLAQMACRHLAQVPPPPQNLTERIWASLPWG